MEHPNSALRYVTADRVDTPAGRLSKTIVVNASNDTLGKLDGIVVDPIRRKLRGYVVESPEWLSSKRYFVPLVMARLDRDHDTLELGVGSEDVDHFDEVDLQAFPPFSEDDLLTALFYARPDEGD